METALQLSSYHLFVRSPVSLFPGVGILALLHLMFAAIYSYLDAGQSVYSTMTRAFALEVRVSR